MAHPQQLKFIELVNDFFVSTKRSATTPLKILEIGSFNVNGSPREFLQDPQTNYVGVDLCEGDGVDVVSYGHEVDFPNESFDFVFSCECFEHDPYWLDTFKNMYRIAKPGALVAFTCASLGRLEHGTRRTTADQSPGTQFVGLDYYKNLTKEDFYRSLKINNLFAEHYFYFERTSFDLYFVGWKSGGEVPAVDMKKFNAEIAKIKRVSQNRFKLVELPIHVARTFMAEERFQDFAISYLSKVRPVRQFFRSLTR